MSKLIVLSADAFVYEDFELLKTLPNFKRFMKKSSYIKNIKSIYPTITYPCHTTMITGVYPEKHGIIRNIDFEVGGANTDWLWFSDNIKHEDDLFKAAKRNGLTTASVFWPVTGNHKDIDYLIDEYWTQNEEDTLEQAFQRTGSNNEVLKIIRKYSPLLEQKERQHPEAEDFMIKCSCDIITEFKPDLLMIHTANMDGYRHNHGVFCDEVKTGVYETDYWIGELMRATVLAGTFEETNFILTSDHGQLDVNRYVSPNIVFAQNGLIDVDENGKLHDWEAYSVSGGMSACVYLKHPDNSKLYHKVYNLLNQMKNDGIYGIGKVYTKDEAKAEHLSENFSFVLETDNDSTFRDYLTGPIAGKLFDANDYRMGAATHGYHPDKGPKPIFVAVGPDIKENVVLKQGKLVDEAPTFAKILGVQINGTDGTAINEILK